MLNKTNQKHFVYFLETNNSYKLKLDANEIGRVKK